MSIEAAAARLAERLLATDFVEVLAHHDADGIAAASILCHALFRKGREFRLRVSPRITPEDVPAGAGSLLCDFGSSLSDLHPDVMVVDHHVPHFDGEYHVNPRLAQIDGDRELSSSGAAYLVAQHMGDNRDLVGLALLGIIGDGQEVAGMNQEICTEGIANGFIAPRRGLRLPGRSLPEQLSLAISPFLPGISGDEPVARELVSRCTSEEDTDLETLISLLVLRISPQTSLDGIYAIYGNTYGLGREVLDEAHTLAAVVDACGKAGLGDLGASLCLRSTAALQEAWDTATAYRLRVIAAIRGVRQLEGGQSLFEVEDGGVASDVADALALCQAHRAPVFVFARKADRYSISARCPPGVEIDLEHLLHSLAAVSYTHL